MATEVCLIVKKGITVPTNNQRVHKTKVVYKNIEKITYQDSHYLFKSVNHSGKIETDAQFAYYLRRKFGIGEYVILAFKKRRKGFWIFLHLKCFESTYIRQPKRLSKDEWQAKQKLIEYKAYQKQMGLAESEEEKKEIRETVSEILDEYEMNKEFANIDKMFIKRGPAGYLKSIMPIYREHEYEDWNTKAPENEGQLHVPDSGTSETKQGGGYVL
jgi:hypothetical protein